MNFTSDELKEAEDEVEGISLDLSEAFPCVDECLHPEVYSTRRIILACLISPRGTLYGLLPDYRAVRFYNGKTKTVPLPKWLQRELEVGNIIYDPD